MIGISIQYTAAFGSHLARKDAEIIGPEIDRLSREGGVDAADVVEAAQEEGSPLHPYLEWDNEIAANQWREHEARHLVHSVHVVVREASEDAPEETVRAFHVVVSSPSAGEKPKGRYHPVDVVMAREDWADQVVSRARTELTNVRKRYSRYQKYIRGDEALSKAFDAIHALDDDD